MLKTVAIEVEVKTLKELGREMDEVAARIKSGEKVEPSSKIVVPSLEAARRILSPERLRLLAFIEERRPKSIYELAKLLGRDRRNILKDIKYLTSLGLIKLSRQSAARRLAMPSVSFNKINIGIDLRKLALPA